MIKNIIVIVAYILVTIFMFIGKEFFVGIVMSAILIFGYFIRKATKNIPDSLEKVLNGYKDNQ
jgi:hypothetical protein